MKSIFTKLFWLCLAVSGLIISTPASPLAVPSLEASMSVSSAKDIDGYIALTVDIALSAPSEPYASLDFNLITSDRDKLSIISPNGGNKANELDIFFAPGYGSAYHPGTDDPESGGFRYLIGFFSQAPGNQITGEVPVCSIRMRYDGNKPEKLEIRDMKAVYIDSAGNVTSVPIPTANAVLHIDSSIVDKLSNTPLFGSWGSRAIWIALIALICLTFAFFSIRHRRKSIA